jgi:hypothetical protein
MYNLLLKEFKVPIADANRYPNSWMSLFAPQRRNLGLVFILLLTIFWAHLCKITRRFLDSSVYY